MTEGERDPVCPPVWRPHFLNRLRGLCFFTLWGRVCLSECFAFHTLLFTALTASNSIPQSHLSGTKCTPFWLWGSISDLAAASSVSLLFFLSPNTVCTVTAGLASAAPMAECRLRRHRLGSAMAGPRPAAVGGSVPGEEEEEEAAAVVRSCIVLWSG